MSIQVLNIKYYTVCLIQTWPDWMITVVAKCTTGHYIICCSQKKTTDFQLKGAIGILRIRLTKGLQQKMKGSYESVLQ